MSHDDSHKINAFISVLREWEVNCVPYDRQGCRKGIHEFQKSRVSKASFLSCLAEQYFRKYKESSLLLLPMYLKRGHLYLSRANSFQIIDLVVNTKVIFSTTLTSLSELAIEMNSASVNEAFFRKFPCLRKLRFHQGCTDETLGILQRCFRKLTLLDCSKDPDCQITDNGLQRLCRIKTLRHVFFNKFCPRQDHSMSKYTGVGIALLMKSLPELVKITCTKVEMIDALAILKRSQSVLQTVTSLDFTGHNINSNILAITKNTCPNIERLAFSVSREDEKLACMRLRPFKTIKELRVNTDESGGQIPNLIRYVIHTFGPHLEVLDLVDVGLAPTEVVYLGLGCLKLKILSISVIGGSEDFVIGKKLFFSLVTLKINSSDLKLLHLFIHDQSSLATLYISYPQGDMTVLCSQTFGQDLCPKLETLLICVESCYQQNQLIYIVNIFENLKLIIIENSKEELNEILTSLRGNQVVLEAVIGFLSTDEYEDDYLDGGRVYNL